MKTKKTFETCRWFLLCEEPATTTVSHPILGEVPTCERCAAKVARLKEGEAK